MNELIKELFEQAEEYALDKANNADESDEDFDFSYEDDVTEKFAELLIKECCSMVNAHVQRNNPHDCPLVLNIKERFGVEQ